MNASLLAGDSANVILLRLRLQRDGEDGEPLSGSRSRVAEESGEGGDALLAVQCERGADGAAALLRRGQIASPTD